MLDLKRGLRLYSAEDRVSADQCIPGHSASYRFSISGEHQSEAVKVSNLSQPQYNNIANFLSNVVSVLIVACFRLSDGGKEENSRGRLGQERGGLGKREWGLLPPGGYSSGIWVGGCSGDSTKP